MENISVIPTMFKSVIKGTVISFLFTIVTLIIFSALLVYTNLPENTITPVIITLTGISVLIGASFGTRKLKKNGLLNGAIVGLCYILILYFLSSILNGNFMLNLTSLVMIAVGVVFGMIGGIIGVNL